MNTQHTPQIGDKEENQPMCPQCSAPLITSNTDNTPDGVERWCENCGWPESDFDEEGREMEALRLLKKVVQYLDSGKAIYPNSAAHIELSKTLKEIGK